MGWVCDFADMEQLDDRYYRIVRANEHNAYQPDSEGDIFLLLDNIWDAFVKKERAVRTKGHGTHLERFEAHVKEELARVIPNLKRYQQLLSNKAWCAAHVVT